MVQLEYSVKTPLNREPELEKLVSSFITEDGYDRNHGPIPHLDVATHRVSVYGSVKQELCLSIQDLEALPQHNVICALQCAGNRRHTMRTKLKEVSGIDWFDGAVMNCKWTGPLLKDVLENAGINLPSDKWKDAHVAFACFQTPTQDDEWYGASIPLSRALCPSARVLLALEMNGKPLSPNHGAPVRIVTPGIAGARSVKWLDRITVQMCESANYYQQHDYKILPPEADCAETAEKWWDKVPAIQDMPVNSVIGVPKKDSTVHRDSQGKVEVKGYALPSGEDGPVVRVEISVDDGCTWTNAELLTPNEADDADSLKWAWCLWKARVEMEKGKDKKILSRATDKAGNVQEHCPKWNFRGVAYNGYGEVVGLKVV
ncbi:sulfite oxidase-like protein [Lindgomyces ingoldianus]|uniref:Sulfite oxidase-like protein n=1 Tax=Lindgomyces ingoldianus TaxID=673940 RepID=A0ACB6QDW0_9PLEO|nr:sulfite oxidase-like protein [Lindgomyces ingoldianus]KAF2465163.1 sulfite oxidase-like protein [Lindgomyces ingoldianus]